jgi:hypothetical protein
MSTIDDVLEWCNQIREADGLGRLAALPKGTHSMYSCPIARATLRDAGTIYVYPKGSRGRILYPSVVREFVEAFDQGQYPELEI